VTISPGYRRWRVRIGVLMPFVTICINGAMVRCESVHEHDVSHASVENVTFS